MGRSVRRTRRTARREYSQDLRDRVVSKWKIDKLVYKTISRHLAIHCCSVRSIVKFYKRHGHSSIPPRTGRPRKTNDRIDRRIVREIKRNRFISAEAIAAQVHKDVEESVSSALVRERIRDAGLHGRSAQKNTIPKPKAPPSSCCVRQKVRQYGS